MYPILIFPKDNNEFQLLSDLLQRMNIEVKSPVMPKITPKRKKKKEILDLVGIWEGRNISAIQLRTEAWQRK